MAKQNQTTKTPTTQAAPTDKTLEQAADQNNTGADNGSQDQSNDNTDGRLLITLPADINEGINEVVAQLRKAYTDVDVEQVLAARFAPEPLTQDNVTSDLVLKPAGFELAFPLEHLGENLDEGAASVQAALLARKAPEGTTFPEELAEFQFSVSVLDRYIKGVLVSGKRLEDAELVFADPETDTVLKSLNFTRLLQGLPATHMYLRFL